jgi:DNA-binding Xre family transcriptional regulator
MVEFRLKEMARKRGITTAYQLQIAMGVDPGTAARLWKKTGDDREGITFGMIDRLCDVLDCEPGDLLGYQKEPMKTKPGQSPRNA